MTPPAKGPAMRPMLPLCALVLAATAAAAADKPMTAAEFDAYSQGKTLYYAIGGQPYGAETYLPDHRVIWAFLGEACKRGTWYESQGRICFVYEGEGDGPQCWTFFSGATGLKAHFEGDPQAADLIEVKQSDRPLVCPGPRVGV